MIMATNTSFQSTLWQKIKVHKVFSFLLVIIILAALMGILYLYYPIGVDWKETYNKLSIDFLHPYVNPTFTNPPWIIFLLPHAWLPLRIGNAINFILNATLIIFVVKRFGGDWKTLLMVFTSPPFFDLARTNNIDWIPMLALLIPPMWGLPLLVLKPHSIGAIVLVWWKKDRFSLRFFIPLLMMLSLSIIIWGAWFQKIGLITESQVWNFSPWPIGIPLGIYLAYQGFTKDDEFLAASATPFLTPYIAPYSITSILAFVGSKYKKEAFFIYAGFWIYFIVESRRLSYFHTF